jgi:hypothetical protein
MLVADLDLSGFPQFADTHREWVGDARHEESRPQRHCGGSQYRAYCGDVVRSQRLDD